MNRPPRIPSYRLHKPSGQAIVAIRGKTIYLGRHGSVESKEVYNRVIAEWLTQGTAAPAPSAKSRATPDLRVAELILAYWGHVQRHYRKDGAPTSEVGVIRQALKVARELYGHSLAKDFGPLALQACRDAMIAKGWSRKSINRQVIRVRAMFRWAASCELLPATIYEALRTVLGLDRGRTEAKEREPVPPVPDDIVEATLPHLPAVPAAMVRLQRVSGMRPQEVVLVRAVDIDMSDSTCWVYKPARHKGEHHEGARGERIIFLGPRAIEIIRPFLSLNILGYLFSPRRSEAARNADRHATRKTPLYRSHVAHQKQKKRTRRRRVLGDRYTVGTYRQAIHRACDKAFPHPELAGMRDVDVIGQQRSELEAWQKAHQWNSHQLRHATATAIRGRYGIEAARTVLGHGDMDTTTIYAERDLETARKVMRELG